MATLTYNEFTNSVEFEGSSRDPMYYWDSHFPQRLSQLHLTDFVSASPSSSTSASGSCAPGKSGGKKRRPRRHERQTARHKTQPITFDEIQEVDEESPPEDAPAAEVRLQTPPSGKTEFMEQCSHFSRSMDGIIKKGAKAEVDSSHPPANQQAKVHQASRARFLQRRRRYRTKSIEEDPAEANKT